MTAVQSNKKQIFLEHNLSLIWNIFPEIKRRRTVRSSKARMNQRDEKKKKTKCFLSGSLQTNHENASPSALGAHMATPQALLLHRKKKEKATVPQRRRHTCSVVAFHQLLTDDVVGEPKTPRSCSSGWVHTSREERRRILDGFRLKRQLSSMDACDDYIKDIINQREQRKGKGENFI